MALYKFLAVVFILTLLYWVLLISPYLIARLRRSKMASLYLLPGLAAHGQAMWHDGRPELVANITYGMAFIVLAGSAVVFASTRD